MKIKILSVALCSTLTASNALASLRTVRCDMDQKQTVVTAQILDGDEIGVVLIGVNRGAGFDVVSAEGLEGKFWKSTSSIDSNDSGKMTFRIKGDDQGQSTATYTFQYKKTPGDGSIASICLVTVEKK